MRTSLQNPRSDLYLPTRARMTVRRGAAGKAMVIFISNIWRRSTEKEEIREMDFWKILSFYCVMNLILEHDHRMLMQDLRGWLEPTYKDKNLVVRVPQQHGNGQSLKKKKKRLVMEFYIWFSVVLKFSRLISLWSKWLKRIVHPKIQLSSFYSAIWLS